MSPSSSSSSSSSPTIILITGANTGLGYQAVRALMRSSRTYHILLGGRSHEKAVAAASSAQAEFPSSSSTLEAVQIDIESDASIASCVAGIEAAHGRLDALVNNAGAQFDAEVAAGRMGEREMWNRSWDVNVAGTQVLTGAAVPLLLRRRSGASPAPPRLLFVTSGTSTLAGTENPDFWLNKSPPKGWPKEGPNVMAYRSAKTGLNMMFREWSRLLREDGVKVFAISPGYLATGLGGSQELNKERGAGDPALGGEFIKDVIEGKRDADDGKIVNRDGVQAY